MVLLIQIKTIIKILETKVIITMGIGINIREISIITVIIEMQVRLIDIRIQEISGIIIIVEVLGHITEIRVQDISIITNDKI